ncbi:MAG TPA: hypothetical protein PK971_15835, partial [Saprospiraceae bacterium]|nr:hypothetical protein [Saprospiraceae bacterium]
MWTPLEHFRPLSPEELDALTDAPVLITILVGAADGNLDREERSWSDRLMRSRTYNNPKALNDFYRIVANGFLDKVDQRLAELPADPERRGQEISQRLSRLNPILAKLDAQTGADLYKGFLALAEETAESSGGFLRIGAISAVEQQWLKLPMLQRIEAPP